MTDRAPVLQISDLVCIHGSGPEALRAVDGVTLNVLPGQTLGLVGESGCGKSTLARAVAGLMEPSSGTVRLDGRVWPVARLAERRARARQVQMVFQDPFSSLNPRLSVARIVGEPLMVHGIGDATAQGKRVADLLDRVGLTAAQGRRYPHELSGGQRQRVAIARALALDPRILVCDEPVSALDVSIQAQVLNLLSDLQKELGLAYLFISHDLSVIRYIADRIAVMYRGRIVEEGASDSVWAAPAHPYTRTLIAAIPGQTRIASTARTADALADAPAASATACRLIDRCALAQGPCAQEPALMPVGDDHSAACWFSR
ncbi:MAG: ABC transporter ATP-binding protein [Pararhodobacter sp.]|nr:ABC transporter ATP-binding protein [Pararhodobacter sp.]